jgi:hypothetical protein
MAVGVSRATREVARSTGGQLSSGYVRTSNQGTHRANADTITPAQYQRRSASSLIGKLLPFFVRDYTPILRVCPKTSVRITKFSEHEPD